MVMKDARRTIASTPNVNKIRDFSSGILKQLAKVLKMLRNMKGNPRYTFAGAAGFGAGFLLMTSQGPPLASILVFAEALNALTLTVSFLVSSPSPRIFTPAARPLARPTARNAASSTFAPSSNLFSSPTLTPMYRTVKRVLMDVRMTGMTGLETLRRIRAADPKLLVILMTAYGTTQTAIEAMKLGAYDYLLKPFHIPRLKEVIANALKAARDMQQVVSYEPLLQSEDYELGIIGRSGGMQQVFKLIGQVSATDATALITGESGTGKELAARAIYSHSQRNTQPFLAINCAAIPEQLLESELFGHEKGAFTGAALQRIGKFEQCNKGTIFLDEIGDMTPPTQT